MYRIHLLPAEYGDSIVVEYGDERRPKRILIDAGTGTNESYAAVRTRIKEISKQDGLFELLVVTHIDLDHIGGVLPLLDEAKALGITFKEIWFNAYEHLTDLLGPKQGEQLSSRIVTGKYPWNLKFGNGAVVVPDGGPLPFVDVDGMKITLLSPKRAQLEKLEKVWREVIEAAGLVPGVGATMAPEEIDDLLGEEAIDVADLARSRFKGDTAEANGSSIAFVAEHDGKSALFGADAFPGLLAESLARLPDAERKRLQTAAPRQPQEPQRGSDEGAGLQELPRLHERQTLRAPEPRIDRPGHRTRWQAASGLQLPDGIQRVLGRREPHEGPWVHGEVREGWGNHRGGLSFSRSSLRAERISTEISSVTLRAEATKISNRSEDESSSNARIWVRSTPYPGLSSGRSTGC
jgi:hypothetical protein